MCTCKAILTTAVAVTGTTLVLTVPATSFNNCEKYLIRIAQDIPATATNLLNVVVQVGAETTTYPIIRRCGHYVYANQVRTRRNYCLLTAADSGQFVLLNDCALCGNNSGAVTVIPVVTGG